MFLFFYNKFLILENCFLKQKVVQRKQHFWSKKWSKYMIKNPILACWTSKEITKVQVTESGRRCQNWNRNYPHQVRVRPSIPSHNYCSNPDSDPQGVWCYTTDPNVRWEYCDVPRCPDQDVYLRTAPPLVRVQNFGIIFNANLYGNFSSDLCYEKLVTSLCK